jgi:glycosyltransferase involved in cell wall biosynthesis
VQESRKDIKVLHLITAFSLGGATENTLLSVEGLQDLGYDVQIVTGPNISSEGDLFERARQNHVRVVVIKELQRSIHPFYDVVAFFKILGVLRKGSFHIIHTHSSKAGILGRVAAKLSGVPLIIHTIHGLPFHDYQSTLMKRIFILAEKIGTALSDKVIAVTKTIIEKALAAGVGRREKFVVVRSGFDTEPFMKRNYDVHRIRAEFGLKPTDFVIGKIARFSKLKGHEYIVDAVPKVIEKVPNAKFLFVGSGELDHEIRERVKQCGVAEHVVFTGLIAQERIPDLIAAMDVVVHTSLLEGLARVLPQALALKKPAISFDIDGAHEVLFEGKTGYLIEPCNTNQLAEAIINILSDKSKAEQMGRAGYELVKNEWTKEAMVKGIDEVYRELLRTKLLLAL